jgi:hypothetical protein
MYNKVENAWILVPMYRCGTDVKTYQSSASIGPRTDVPIFITIIEKKEIIKIHIRGEMRGCAAACARNVNESHNKTKKTLCRE